MKRSIKQSADEFRTHWKNYILQSLLATGVVFTVLVFLSVQNNAVIIASIGATTFIVCAMPNDLAAKPRNIIGGYIVSLICGIICAIIPYPSFLPHLVSSSLIYAAAVGLSIFIMVVTDTEHPPAAAMALGVALRRSFSWNVIAAVLISAVVLSLIHFAFKRHLKDLT